jgi:hypothetical protein
MPIQGIVRLYDTSDPPEEIGIRLNGVGKDGFMEILYADIPGNSWNQNRLNKFTLRAQDMIDVRIPLDDPQFMEEGVVVDPDALVDPARPDFFWDSGDLVSRTIIISDVSFTDRLNFTLTRAR